MNAAESDGTTALHWAVYQNDVELVERLIKAGANVNAMNEYGSAPLAEAAATGNTAIIEKLLKAGADPESAERRRPDRADGRRSHDRISPPPRRC